MTTPAQIEAARAEIKVALVGLSDRSTSPAFIAERLDCAYAALTAAAEVGRPEYEYVEGQAVAISAGPAEVGEPEDWITKRADIRNSAIERCAQVAENYTAVYGCSQIAAAIRALKDK